MHRYILNGFWYAIIAALLPELIPALNNPHMHFRCPVHGGKDGFRFFYDVNESGGGICNTCGAFPTGFKIIAWIKQISEREAFNMVIQYIKSEGISMKLNTLKNSDQPASKPTINEGSKILMDRVLSESIPFGEVKSLLGREYFRNRGIGIPTHDLPLLFNSSLAYELGGPDAFGVIIAPILNHHMTVGLHCTFLNELGDKIPGENPKKIKFVLWKGATTGGGIYLSNPKETLFVTEGLETALAVAEMNEGASVCSALNANNLGLLEVPDHVTEVIICGDYDASGVGQNAAKKLAQRMSKLGKEARVVIPEPVPTTVKSFDWLDCLVMLKKHGH